MTRDYRSDAYRQALLNELDPATGLPARQASGASYTMAAPTWGQPGATAGSFEDLTANYERRNEGAGGFGSGAAKGASMGAAAGSVLPGLGTAVGAGIGALAGGIGGLFTKNAKTAATDFSLADAQSAIGNAYRSKMGRDASQQEIDSQIRGQGWQDGDRWVGEAGLRAIIDSLDPRNDAKPTQAGLPGPASGAGANAGFGNASAASPQMSAPGSQFTGGSGALVDPYTLPSEADIEGLLANAQRYGGYDASTGRVGAAGSGGGQGYSYLGFDFGQDPGSRDVGKSAKYAFSHLSSQAANSGAPQPRTKAEAEAWFNQFIAPGLQQLGYEVGWVKGDKARIKTREGWDEIDFLGNADGDNPQLTWQSEVLAPGGGMSAGAGSGAPATASADLGSSALFDQLLQQAKDIAAGKPTGNAAEQNALLAILEGKYASPDYVRAY